MELESIKLENQRLKLEFHRLEFQISFISLFCSVYSERSNRLLCFFQWNSSFIDSSSPGKFFFLVLLCLLREVQEGALFSSVFSSRTRVSQTRVLWKNFFFFVLLCFPLLIPGIIHWGIFFFFFPGHADKPETETCACTW